MEGKLIYKKKGVYSRYGLITLQDNKLIADNSDGEYSDIEIDLDELLEKIRIYREELNSGK